MKTKGIIFIISAPSGTGKTSLLKEVLPNISNLGLCVSHTSREIRENEINKVHYNFVDKSVFKQMIEDNEFLEYANVFNNYYGTSFKEIEKIIFSGKNVVLEIDWQGAIQVYDKYKKQVVSIAILPPSIVALSDRLVKRNTDSQEVINHRMAQARNEISQCKSHDYVVINDDFKTASKDLLSILEIEMVKKKNNILMDDLLKEIK